MRLCCGVFLVRPRFRLGLHLRWRMCVCTRPMNLKGDIHSLVRGRGSEGLMRRMRLMGRRRGRLVDNCLGSWVRWCLMRRLRSIVVVVVVEGAVVGGDSSCFRSGILARIRRGGCSPGLPWWDLYSVLDCGESSTSRVLGVEELGSLLRRVLEMFPGSVLILTLSFLYS